MRRRCPKCGGTIWRLGNGEHPYYCNNCKERFTESEVAVHRTHADRIRERTDEELAEWVSGVEQFALTRGSAWSREQWLDWMKQEEKE